MMLVWPLFITYFCRTQYMYFCWDIDSCCSDVHFLVNGLSVVRILIEICFLAFCHMSFLFLECQTLSIPRAVKMTGCLPFSLVMVPFRHVLLNISLASSALCFFFFREILHWFLKIFSSQFLTLAFVSVLLIAAKYNLAVNLGIPFASYLHKIHVFVQIFILCSSNNHN